MKTHRRQASRDAGAIWGHSFLAEIEKKTAAGEIPWGTQPFAEGDNRALGPTGTRGSWWGWALEYRALLSSHVMSLHL